MNTVDYIQKLDDILSDSSKFKIIIQDPTESIKKNLNEIVEKVKDSNLVDKILNKAIGHFSPGYIYGNPKIHKDNVNPPLRPIISTIPTPGYEISKKVNHLIRPYISKNYSVESTQEFMGIIKSTTPNEIVASLDVVSLFTNVPVHKTIQIILDSIYRNNELPPIKIPENELKELLLICTTQTPFRAPNDQLYVQVDGVSMGCVLEHTFANFYMGYLESEVLDTVHFDKIYCRYVDDIFLSVGLQQDIDWIKSSFESHSVLQFTIDYAENNIINFLDVQIEVSPDKSTFSTSVYTKKSNNGDCINYLSLCPFRYKEGVIKTLLHRAYTICSSWKFFDEEIKRIKQLLTNNNFPTVVIDKTINNFLKTKFKTQRPETKQDKENLQLYFEGQMTSSYLHQEKVLKAIIKKWVKPNENTTLKTTIFYKNRKLKQLLIKNSSTKSNLLKDQSNVVYSYQCNAGCNANKYIGYTTNTLETRMKQHSYSGAIRKHHEDEHNVRIKYGEIITNTSILQRSSSRNDLLIMEALLIKERRPIINLKDEGRTRILRIF
jgi:hypothetical protein